MKEEIEGQRSDVLAEAWDAIEKGLPKEKGQAGAAWYETWKKEHGRAPKEEELAAIAYALTVGEDAPQVEGFNQGAEVAVIRAAAKENLDAIDKKRKALDAIKERMTELTGIEMRQTETLTGEGYRVYRHILSDLKSADNPKVTRAARISALLFARHADIYAAAMRKRGGEYAGYTAMDYYNKAFALDISGKAPEDGERLNQEAANTQMAAERLKEDETAWGNTVDSFMKGEIKSGVNSRIMGTPLVFQLIQDDLGIPIEAGIPLKIHYGILHKILRDTKNMHWIFRLT